jgi:beta-glucanase (GH16 family)
MSKIALRATLLLFIAGVAGGAGIPVDRGKTAIDPKNLDSTATLTFRDEFNGGSVNLWNGVSRARGSGWNTNYWWADAKGSTLPGNGEVEWYINHLYRPTSNAIEAGDIVLPWRITKDANGSYLTLTASPVKDKARSLINGYRYSSGMVQSYYTHTQTYGYFEMRAKLPAGKGVWPAFWLLPADGSWPPEIDIVEVLGHEIDTLHTTVHTNEFNRHTSKGTSTVVPDMSSGFHTYGVDWQADYITWYFDGRQVFKAATPSDLNKPMYMIANITVGGNWPGMPDNTTPWPAEMHIDYIRAYSELRAGAR